MSIKCILYFMMKKDVFRAAEIFEEFIFAEIFAEIFIVPGRNGRHYSLGEADIFCSETQFCIKSHLRKFGAEDIENNNDPTKTRKK